MADHRFRVGQRVTLTGNVRRPTASGYVVTKHLPERNGEFEYRIKTTSEAHERVARESELTQDTTTSF